jgi:4-hydroxythreonine-4-phosphate dehydrogenase
MNGELKTREIPRIAFVMGDPAGISAEIAAKLLVDRTIHERASLLVIGDRHTLAEGERIAGVETNIKIVSEPITAKTGEPLFYDLRNSDPKSVPLGRASLAGGASVMANSAPVSNWLS